MTDRAVELKSYAKVNLSLHVTARRADGYHDIHSMMQGIDLADGIRVIFRDEKTLDSDCFINEINVKFCTDNSTIPAGKDNLVLRGAEAILNKAPTDIALPAEIEIELSKRLPVAAGIAGGSGNAAVTMLAINRLLGNPFSLDELMETGPAVGADVPFSLMMNARANAEALDGLKGLDRASTAAIVRGTGQIVEPAEPIKLYLILMNPGASVSTAEAYTALDAVPRRHAPEGAGESYPLWVNDFERCTYGACRAAGELKAAMDAELSAEHVLLSGSGPTVVAYYDDRRTAQLEFSAALEAKWFKREWKAWYAVSGGITDEL